MFVVVAAAAAAAIVAVVAMVKLLVVIRMCVSHCSLNGESVVVDEQVHEECSRLTGGKWPWLGKGTGGKEGGGGGALIW